MAGSELVHSCLASRRIGGTRLEFLPPFHTNILPTNPTICFPVSSLSWSRVQARVFQLVLPLRTGCFKPLQSKRDPKQLIGLWMEPSLPRVDIRVVICVTGSAAPAPPAFNSFFRSMITV